MKFPRAANREGRIILIDSQFTFGGLGVLVALVGDGGDQRQEVVFLAPQYTIQGNRELLERRAIK